MTNMSVINRFRWKTPIRIGHIAHIIMAYCSSGGDFTGANDGEKSCVASQPTYNAIMTVISQVETSPHFHEDKFYLPCFACCGGLCWYQDTRSPYRFPLNPSEPPPKVAHRSVIKAIGGQISTFHITICPNYYLNQGFRRYLVSVRKLNNYYVKKLKSLT